AGREQHHESKNEWTLPRTAGRRLTRPRLDLVLRAGLFFGFHGFTQSSLLTNSNRGFGVESLDGKARRWAPRTHSQSCSWRLNALAEGIGYTKSRAPCARWSPAKALVRAAPKQPSHGEVASAPQGCKSRFRRLVLIAHGARHSSLASTRSPRISRRRLRFAPRRALA